MSLKSGNCMHRGPNADVARTPVQFATGCGGFQRNSPVGGAANGMPLYMRTPVAAFVAPAMTPFRMVTCGGVCAAMFGGAATSPTMVTLTSTRCNVGMWSFLPCADCLPATEADARERMRLEQTGPAHALVSGAIELALAFSEMLPRLPG